MPPLPPVIRAVRTQHLSALAPRQCLRRQRHDPLLWVGGEEERLGVGEMARRPLAGVLGAACRDRFGDLVVNGQRDAALAYRWVLASGHRLLAAALSVAIPNGLQAADHRDHGVV